MNPNDLTSPHGALAESDDLLSPLLQAPFAATDSAPSRPEQSMAHITGVVVGELLALTDGGATPLVRYPGQAAPQALRARSTVDLHGQHIGRGLVLMFEQGDPARPIVMGVLREGAGWPLPAAPAQVEVDADGERMVVSAKEQLVLRCGKASITLTKAGKVLVEGSYVLSRSSGVNRIKGGSVQLN